MEHSNRLQKKLDELRSFDINFFIGLDQFFDNHNFNNGENQNNPINEVNEEIEVDVENEDVDEIYADDSGLKEDGVCNAPKSETALGFEKKTSIKQLRSIVALNKTVCVNVAYRELKLVTGVLLSARPYPMIGGNSELNLRNKLLLIKQVIQPRLTYASTAWGYAGRSHLKRIRAVKNIVLRRAVDAPWFVRNADLKRDLEYTPVMEEIQAKAIKI